MKKIMEIISFIFFEILKIFFLKKIMTYFRFFSRNEEGNAK